MIFLPHTKVSHEILSPLKGFAEDRFSMSSDRLFDKTTGDIYVRTNLSFKEAHVHTVDGISTDPTVYVPWSRLYMMRIFDLSYVPDVLLAKNDFGWELKYMDAGALFSHYATIIVNDPVYHTFHTDYAHVPFNPCIIVKEDGTIRLIDQNKEITFNDIDGKPTSPIMMPDGQVHDIEPARLVIWAYGLYDESNMYNEIIFADGDKTNLSKDNLILSGKITENKVVAKP